MRMGVWFGKKHTYKDFGLHLSSYDIPLPTVKTQFETVPGMDGYMDYTDYPNGARFESFDAEFTFTCVEPRRFFAIRRDLGNYLHGKRFEIVVDTNLDYYWDGRCEINKFKTSAATFTITVKARCQPWERRRNMTKVKQVLSLEYETIRLHNGKMPVTPMITFSVESEIRTATGDVYEFDAGAYKPLDLQLTEGLTVWEARTSEAESGTITIEYRQGAL